MGTSSDGQLCFGICVEEDVELPWDGYDDIEEWWRVVNGFKHSIEIFTDDGEYIGGHEPAKGIIDTYCEETRVFDERHPLPVELVWHCSYDYPAYIVAVPGTFMRASRGYPKPVELRRITPDEVVVVQQFCNDWEIPTVGEPQWWLSSMYG